MGHAKFDEICRIKANAESKEKTLTYTAVQITVHKSLFRV